MSVGEDDFEAQILEDQIRQELLAHLATCNVRPERDEVEGRTRYDTPNRQHVCEHIASAVAARRYFEWSTQRDPGAIDEMRVVCLSCRDGTDRNESPSGDRWIACSCCIQEYEMRRGWPDLLDLAPRYSETFKPWWERVRSRMLAVPPDVADQWIHRHWGQSSFETLPVLNMNFMLEVWPLSEVLEVRAGARDYPRPDHLGAVPREIANDCGLGKFMRTNRTWPRPIIVLDNRSGLYPNLHEVQLIEGHTRLGYLRTLAKEGIALAEHDVWVMQPHADASAKR